MNIMNGQWILNIINIVNRYPLEVSPWLNLINLMSPTSWMWILASLVSVTFCFNIASRFVSRKMGLKLENIEIDLCPFRYIDYY